MAQDQGMGPIEITATLGVNNLFDEDYNNNIRINAFGGRYFEPAPERNGYIGITLRRRFFGRSDDKSQGVVSSG